MRLFQLMILVGALDMHPEISLKILLTKENESLDMGIAYVAQYLLGDGTKQARGRIRGLVRVFSNFNF